MEKSIIEKQNNIEELPITQRRWFVILFLIFIPIVGLVFMWLSQQFSNLAKIIITSVFVVLPILIVMISIFSSMTISHMM